MLCSVKMAVIHKELENYNKSEKNLIKMGVRLHYPEFYINRDHLPVFPVCGLNRSTFDHYNRGQLLIIIIEVNC